MTIIELAPLAAEAESTGVPLWQIAVLVMIGLTILATALLVWAVLRLTRTKRGS